MAERDGQDAEPVLPPIFLMPPTWEADNDQAHKASMKLVCVPAHDEGDGEQPASASSHGSDGIETSSLRDIPASNANKKADNGDDKSTNESDDSSDNDGKEESSEEDSSGEESSGEKSSEEESLGRTSSADRTSWKGHVAAEVRTRYSPLLLHQ